MLNGAGNSQVAVTGTFLMPLVKPFVWKTALGLTAKQTTPLFI